MKNFNKLIPAISFFGSTLLIIAIFTGRDEFYPVYTRGVSIQADIVVAFIATCWVLAIYNFIKPNKIFSYALLIAFFIEIILVLQKFFGPLF
jgi:hypothetical protein